MKCNLEKQVSELFGKMQRILFINCIDRFPGFFHHVRSQAFMGLFPVPRTSVAGSERIHNFHQIRKCFLFSFEKAEAFQSNCRSVVISFLAIQLIKFYLARRMIPVDDVCLFFIVKPKRKAILDFTG